MANSEFNELLSQIQSAERESAIQDLKSRLDNLRAIVEEAKKREQNEIETRKVNT